MTDEQIADFAIRKRQITEKADLGQSQQTYLSNTAAAEGARQSADLATRYGKMLERSPWRFAGRGLLNSGIKGHADIQAAQDFSTNKANLAARLQEQQAGYTMAGQQLQQVAAGGLGDIDKMMAAAKSAAAAQAIREAAGSI